MATDFFSAAVSSAAVERAFSAAKLIVTPTRNRLKPELIEALLCLKVWSKSSQRFEIYKSDGVVALDEEEEE